MNCQRKKFNLNKKFAYLNCAYMSPMPKKVEKAGTAGMKAKRQPRKVTQESFFRDAETLRILYASLINCSVPDRIVIVPSVPYGIGHLVNNLTLEKGENVVLTEGQFPGNVRPWRNLCDKNGAELVLVAPPDTEERRGDQWNGKILEAISERTKAISLGHVHWADGTLFQLGEIRKQCDKVGAAMIIDGSQSIGAYPFDIQKVKPDALLVAGYKWLLGPYNSGLAYYGPRFDDGPAGHNGDFPSLADHKDGQQGDPIANPMLIAAIKQLRVWGPENVQEYCEALIGPVLRAAEDLGLYVEDAEARAAHLFGIKFPKEKMAALAKALKINRVNVSVQGGFVRVSPHVYNDGRDMGKLIRALKEAI